MIESLRKIFILLKEKKGDLFIIYLSFFIISLLDILGLGLIGPFINNIFNKKSYFLSDFFNLNQNYFLFYISGLIILLFFIKIILSLILAKKVIKFGQLEQVRLRIMFLKKLYSLPLTQLNNKSSSEYLNIQQSVIPIFTSNLMGVLQLLGDIIIAIFITTFLLIKNPIIFLGMLSIIGITIYFYNLFVKNKLIIAGTDSNKFSAKMILNIKEALKGFREFKVFDKENLIIKNLEFNSKLYANAQTNINFLNWIPRYLLEIISVLTLVVFILSIKMIFDGNIESLLPTLGVFAFGAIRLLPISRNISYVLNRMNSSKNSIDIIYELFGDYKSYSKKNIEFKNFKKIVLENISFKYSSSKNYIFKNLNLTIHSNEKILIYGDSGKGKTTLLNLILGFLKPNEGKIFFNDRQISPKNNIWRNMAYLPQDVFISEDTLKKNITLGENINSKKINKLKTSIDKSGLKKLIDELPEGLNSYIGENGTTISGGQKQRIALARAFYFGKRILILDEATTSLDQEAEKEIFRQIQKLKGITLIMISHKKVPIIKFDKKINLNKVFD